MPLFSVVLPALSFSKSPFLASNFSLSVSTPLVYFKRPSLNAWLPLCNFSNPSVSIILLALNVSNPIVSLSDPVASSFTPEIRAFFLSFKVLKPFDNFPAPA